mgnify:CR=1 FL=1
MKKKLLSFGQLVLGLAVLAYILLRLERSGDFAKLKEALAAAAANWPLIVGGITGFGFCIFLCILRWQLLLTAVGIRLPLGRLAELFFIGQFFNALMFGATGGDLVKAYYVAAETRHKKTEVVATVFIDRIIGLMALVAMTMVIMLARLNFFMARPETRAAFTFNVVLIVISAVAMFLVFGRKTAEHIPCLRRLESSTISGRIVLKAYSAFAICLRDRQILIKTIILSLLNHLVLIVCIFYFGLGVGSHLAFLDYLTVFPVINAIAALPITPSGLGTRESAALFLLGVLGVPPATAVTISLLIYAAIMMWSLIGGGVYFAYTYHHGKAPLDSPDSA